MKRETRIALLVGMIFIAVFGLVLGRRSLKIASASRGQPTEEPVSDLLIRPGPELTGADLDERERDDQPVLSPALRPQEQPAGAEPGGVAPGGVAPGGEASQQRHSGDGTVPQERPGPAPQPGTTEPPAKPRRVPPPPRSVRRTYKVQRGDSLIRIAKNVYGANHGGEYRRIYLANRDKLRDVSTLSVGQELIIPPLADPSRAHYTEMTLEALGERFSRGRTYVVRAGDTLTAIAKQEMGSSSRAAVSKLHEANRHEIDDPDRLPVGLRLRIPL